MREGSVRGTNGKLQATIFKKCSREYHRPESNKGCANGTCQHTCEASGVEKCAHKWTVRYVVNGKQHASADSRELYMSNYRTAIKGRFGHRTLAQMSTPAAAEEVAELLNTDMAASSIGHRRVTRMIITGTMDAAARAEKIGRHKLTGLRLTEGTRTPADPVTGQGTGRKRTLITTGVGIAAWLQRTIGLRIREALGVEKADFRTRKNGERYLRLRSQATRDGRSRVPLKHRREGEGRNVPVSDYVWDMVQAMPDGPLCPGITTRYMQYNTARTRFAAITDALKIDGYTTHSLRHQFASECLDDGMNIMDLSAVLGHADPSVTLRTYVHAMPDAEARTRAMMNARWTKPALKAAA